jgi:hypothetical protein
MTVNLQGKSLFQNSDQTFLGKLPVPRWLARRRLMEIEGERRASSKAWASFCVKSD